MLPYFAQSRATLSSAYSVPLDINFTMVAPQKVVAKQIAPSNLRIPTNTATNFPGNKAHYSSHVLVPNVGDDANGWSPVLNSDQRLWSTSLLGLALDTVSCADSALGCAANLDSERNLDCSVGSRPDGSNTSDCETSLQEPRVIPRRETVSHDMVYQHCSAVPKPNGNITQRLHNEAQLKADSLTLERKNRSEVDKGTCTEALDSFIQCSSAPEVTSIPRLNILEQYRCRLGLGSQFTAQSCYQDRPSLRSSCQMSRSSGPRGALLPRVVLERIIRHMLSTARPDIPPSHVLRSLVRVSKRVRSVAAPYAYGHVTLRAKGDIGVYARTGVADHVQRITIYFNVWNLPDLEGIRQDDEAFPHPESAGGYQTRGLFYTFPRCREIKLIVECDCINSQRIYLTSLSAEASDLLDMIPPAVGKVILESDMSDLSARFIAGLATRRQQAKIGIIIELRTSRDDVVYSVESALHSCASQETGFGASQVHIILHGSSYGTDIIWGKSHMTQTIWKRPALAEVNKLSQPDRRIRDRDDDDGVLGPKELITVIPMPDARALKQKIMTSLYPPSKRSGKKGQRTRQAGVLQYTAPTLESVSSLTPKSGPQNHTSAWYAGKLVAEMPDTIEQIVEELKRNDPTALCPCPSHQRAPGIIRHPETKADLDAFFESYSTRQSAAWDRAIKLGKMHEQAQAKRTKHDMVRTNDETPEERSRKRRRHAIPVDRMV